MLREDPDQVYMMSRHKLNQIEHIPDVHTTMFSGQTDRDIY